MKINFNIALITFFNEKEDLPRFHEFIETIKSYKRCEIALHGLCQRRNGEFDNFHSVTKSTAEEEIRTGSEILKNKNKN